MASVEHSVISKVLQERDILPAVKAGITSDHFYNATSRAHWEWIHGYWQEHGTSPTLAAFRRNFPNAKPVDMEGERWPALLGELAGLHKERIYEQGLATIFQQSGDLPAATQAMRQLLEDLVTADALSDTDVTEGWAERLERYEDYRRHPNKLRGITTGFETLDTILGGWRSQQFATVIGTPKKGKSLLLLVMAMAAHACGLRPMLMTFEMSNEEQEARYDALLAHLDSNALLRGSITGDELERLRQAMRLVRNRPPFILVEDPSSTTTISAVAAKVQEHNPSIVFIDGMYLMDDERGNPQGSPAALTQITRGLKRLAQQYKIPVIGTTQALEWKTGRSGRLSTYSIGYTSSFAQDSDVVLGVESDPEDATIAIVRVLAARSAARGELRINWDWKNGDFTELFEEYSKEGDDDFLD